MKAYKQEILDGIATQVESTASIALDAEILVDSDYLHPSQEDIHKTLAAHGHSNPDQMDLYYLNSVLVSTGWNKNDDVFDPQEIWAARNTPVDKQFNYMHNEADIIGHITGGLVVDKDGVKVDGDEVPDSFDIITSAVLYKSWSDPALQERMIQLVSEIEDGKWAVSMECLFSDFDYSVVSPKGDKRVVARNEDSAWLTKHLRVYGGEGEYDGYKIGRLLRNIAFSGKGLVNKPANPRSVILKSDTDPFEPNSNSLTIKEFSVMAEDKTKDSEAEVVASVDEKLETLKAEKDQEISDLTQEGVNKDATITDLQSQIATLNTELETVKADLTQASTKLDEANASIRVMTRTSQAKEAGIEEAKVSEILTQFDSVDDEAFAAMLGLVKDQANVFLQNQPKKDAVTEPAPEPDPEPEVVAENVSEDDVEDVELEAEAALVSPPDDETEDRFTATAGHFRTVLKTTKNLK
jgi:hypothetical protein